MTLNAPNVASSFTMNKIEAVMLYLVFNRLNKQFSSKSQHLDNVYFCHLKM